MEGVGFGSQTNCIIGRWGYRWLRKNSFQIRRLTKHAAMADLASAALTKLGIFIICQVSIDAVFEMIMKNRLLRECETARKELRRCEKAVVGARAAFEESLRRLYVAGASTGKIAEALGLSRQRVHQVIGAVPKPHERRANSLSHKPSRGCSFCGKSTKHVGKLVAGPNVHICNGCIGAASMLLANRASQSESHFARLPSDSRKPCSFCGQRKEGLARASAGGHQICGNCLALVKDLAAASAD